MADPIANDYSFINARLKEIQPHLQPAPKPEAKKEEPKKTTESGTYYGLSKEEWEEYAIQAAGF